MGSLEGGSRRMSDLAAEHGVRLPTMTRQIGRLARDGLVTRGRDDRGRAGGHRRAHADRPAAPHLRAVSSGSPSSPAAWTTLNDAERASIEAALPALEKLFAGVVMLRADAAISVCEMCRFGRFSKVTVSAYGCLRTYIYREDDPVCGITGWVDYDRDLTGERESRWP